MENSALVIGGGISGIQAALDLANANVRVIIVEKSPSIGGRMAQLDKTFPTNDCSMCILSPKLVEANRHPNITIFTNSELEELAGEKGKFKAKVKRHARFVDEDKCIGCGICAEKCPVKVPNEFDQKIGERKAIYIPFPQAVPLKYTIDRANCIYYRTGKCKACLKYCPKDAVVFDQEDELVELDIGSIVVATGFDIYEPSDRPEYFYGRHPDVITSMEFERMLSPTGPTAGKVLRRSDETAARKIVFLNCVGSRNVNKGVPYCSRVCCMYTIKEALIAKEHSEELEELTVLYTDIRAFGKNFDAYYHRARYEEGVRFLRGYSTSIDLDPKTNRLIVSSEDTMTGELSSLDADLVVLATAVLPSATNVKMADILGLELDSHGFFKLEDRSMSPVRSTRDGIYICGCAPGPKDIPDSVSSSSSAASLALDDMDRTGSNDTREAEALPMGHGDEDAQIGVFVCHCGTNIGSVVDVENVAEYARGLPNVVYAEDNLFSCSDATQQKIKEIIAEHHLNRVVVASCTPRTHEPLFQDTVKEGGLNPYLFEMANIREHCSWVHREQKEEATIKARELLRLAVAKASLLSEFERQNFELVHTAVVVGGGISGMQAAIDLARKGIKTYLVEKKTDLGGRLRQLDRLTVSDVAASRVLSAKLSEIDSLKPTLEVLTDTVLTSVKGSIGNFELELKGASGERKLDVGAVVISIGSDVYDPTGEFGYGEFDHVLTNLDLEQNLKSGDGLKFRSGKPKTAVYILCVGSRTQPEGKTSTKPDTEDKPSNPGCSRVCCDVGIKQSTTLQEAGIDTTVLYRDMRTFDSGSEEQYYNASEKGVKFIRYDPSGPPELTKDGKKVTVFDTLTGEEIELDADLVVLGCGMVPRTAEVAHLQNMLKIPKSADGFFLEAHPKLAPLETTTGGIYLCGTASYPKSISDAMMQGAGSALKAAILLYKNALETEPVIAIVDQSICWGCGTCKDVCIYGAPGLVVSEKGSGSVSYINPTLCKGCGTCSARCPSGAINANMFTDKQLLAMVCALEED